MTEYDDKAFERFNRNCIRALWALGALASICVLVLIVMFIRWGVLL